MTQSQANRPDSTSESVEAVDVAVIGAGVAGLTAARELVAGGRRIKVLEARSRVGGRLWSKQLQTAGPGQVLDLGATWFWPNEPLVGALINELGLPVHAQYIDGDALYQKPDGVARLDGNPLDVPSGRFVGGGQALPQALADGLDQEVLLLNSQAHRISVAGDGWALRVGYCSGSDDDADVLANHVVVALPPALAVHHINFSPGLAAPLAELAAATPVWMGSTAKIVVRYQAPFWRDQGLAGAAISHVGPMGEIHDMSGPDGEPAALFGFAPLVGRAGPPTESEIVAQLIEIFGPQAASPAEVIVADWRSEPFTAPPGADQLANYQTYGHPLFQEPAMGGRLHWASTETSTVIPGHIEGAIAAAKRAVAAITNHSPIGES